jgi:small subunit ribosomal protein S13
MVRIAGIDLPTNKKIEYSLTKIYGIGLTSAQAILTKANVNFSKRTHELTSQNITSIRQILDTEYLIESDLKRKISLDIKRLHEINCLRGKRHRQQLPLRGQRTRTNARTRRGQKKPVNGKKK